MKAQAKEKPAADFPHADKVGLADALREGFTVGRGEDILSTAVVEKLQS